MRFLTMMFMLVGFFPHAVWAQEILPVSHFEEILREADDPIPVSGDVRMGVQLDEVSSNVDPDSLTVFLPQGNWKNLCVRINSIDGRYEAMLAYTIDNIDSGEKYKLKYPTQYPGELMKYTPKELAIYAELKDACEAETQQITIASWQPDNALTKLTLLLNTGKDNIVKIKVPPLQGEQSHIVRCHIIETDKTALTYNFECILSIVKNTYDYSKTRVYIQEDSELLEPIMFPLILP